MMKNLKFYILFAFQLTLIHSNFPCLAELQNLNANHEKPIEIPSRLKEEYEYHSALTSDINEHLPVLKNLAQDCSSVVEIGVRSLVSTWGILQGLSERGQKQPSYIGIDLYYPPKDRLDLAKKLAQENGVDFTFWRVNDMHIDLEPADMLFIDSLHTYCHLTYELETFSHRIRKYICMHDTSDPWGHGDPDHHTDFSDYPEFINKEKVGLWTAVEDFLAKHPEWSLLERRTNNHGFTILKRNEDSAVVEHAYHPEIDHYLKNKIILCTGPALGRYQMLKNTTEDDMNLISFKKIFVVTNDPEIMNITFNGVKPVCQLIEDWRKDLDCLNCNIQNLKNVVNDPEVEDDDIILFKHESLFISDMGLIKRAISKMLDGYDMVVRSWIVPNSPTRCTDMYYVKVSAVRDIVKDFPLVSSFIPEAPYCEHYFTAFIVNKVAKVFDVPYEHSNWKFTELGFYHIPRLTEDPNWYWNKNNYHDLYN